MDEPPDLSGAIVTLLWRTNKNPYLAQAMLDESDGGLARPLRVSKSAIL